MNENYLPRKLQKLSTYLTKLRLPGKLIFVIMGIASTIWFLVRVLPKPSRATYPCMQAVAPFMSGFIFYILTLTGSVYAFKKIGFLLRNARYFATVIAIVGGLTTVFIASTVNTTKSSALSLRTEAFVANEPMGVAQGAIPGRVVWVWDPDATNENLVNTSGDYWYHDNNTNQEVVDKMLADGIKALAGKEDNKEAWDGLFKYFNAQHGKGSIGYTEGEKIAIKLNLTNSCCNMDGTNKTRNKERMDSSPQMTLALLKQLIEVVGVAQEDIYIGDTYRPFRDEHWDKCHSVYPNVHYMDGLGINGREQSQPSGEQLLIFSDGQETSSIPQHYINATYFINMPCFKTHDTAGLTFAAKNHQGSVLREGDPPSSQSAMYMHYAFPQNNPAVNQFRHLVDYLGHEQLGGKTLLNIVEGIWGGRSWEGYIDKFQMTPFNNDYVNSLFLSQDRVAIESVCFDFMLEEYKNKPSDEKYPYMTGVEDYLKQSADPSTWPAGIVYDPEGDGTPLESMGVYEHWNNPIDKQYSRNLGTGNGIELVSVPGDLVHSSVKNVMNPGKDYQLKSYPNPATDFVNFEFVLDKTSDVRLELLNLNGQKVVNIMNERRTAGAQTFRWDLNQNGIDVQRGIYLCRMSVASSNLKESNTIRINIQ